MRTTRKTHPPIVCALTALFAAGAGAQADDISWFSIDAGGRMQTLGATYELSGTIGQHDTGVLLTGGPYGLAGGFWAVPALPPCPADFNGDGSVNTLDVLAFLNAWAAGDPAADINGDGAVNTLDVLAFLNLWTAGC